jgi:hypothetical protein
MKIELTYHIGLLLYELKIKPNKFLQQYGQNDITRPLEKHVFTQ